MYNFPHTAGAASGQTDRQEDERLMVPTSWRCLWTSPAAGPDGLEGHAALIALVDAT